MLFRHLKSKALECHIRGLCFLQFVKLCFDASLLRTLLFWPKDVIRPRQKRKLNFYRISKKFLKGTLEGQVLFSIVETQNTNCLLRDTLGGAEDKFEEQTVFSAEFLLACSLRQSFSIKTFITAANKKNKH